MTSSGPRLRLTLLASSLILILAAVPPFAARAEDFGATEWNLKVDPPASPPAAPTVKDFAVPFPGNFGGGGEIVYPSTPSRFVVIGKNFFDNDVRQVWDLAARKQVGQFRGKLGLDDRSVALSGDGAYLAGKTTHRPSVEVRQTRNGRVAQSFDTDSPFVDFVDFAAGDRVVFGRLQDRKLQVCDIKSGDKVCDLALVKEADREAVAFSPGAKYLAVASWGDGTLRVYDLATGKVVGEAPTPKKNGQNVRCFGLAFAPDGSELAGLFEYFGQHRVVCWNAADGKMAADFDLGKEITRPTFYKDRGIDWFPDRSAWLVLGHAVVDREAGKKVWVIPFDNQNFKVSPRRFLDNEHAMIVTFAPSMNLRTAVVPRDKIAGAAKIVRSGGNAADASLPPLRPADLAAAKKVTLEGKPGAWSVAPDAGPASRRLTSRPVALKGKPDEFRALLFAGPGSSEVAVVGTPKAAGNGNEADGQPRWVERFDLAGGRALGRVDLPNVSDPIALSPDGSAFLLREARARDRLDLVAAADGKHLAGWRPYEKESGEDRAVAWAGFLGAGRVLTLNAGGTLILWSVPACQAVYIVEDAFRGEPALSPGRKLLAGFDGKALRVLDAETGALKGEGIAPTGLGTRAEAKHAAFRPDGGEVAAQFGDGRVFRWDLKTGKLAPEFKPAVALPGSALEWSGNTHVLIDNRSLVDVVSRRPVWEYLGAPVGAPGPDGRHWYVGRGIVGQEGGRLIAADTPDPSLEKAEALLADPNSPALIRPGSRVSIQLDLAGPPKDNPAYRKAVTEALAAKLKAAGLTVVDDGPPTSRPPGTTRVSYVRPAAGPDARVVLAVTEKDTGRTITFQGIGRSRGNVQSIKLIDLVAEMSIVDATGPVSCGRGYTAHMQPFGFVLRMPAGETDAESYLKKLQWDRVKTWATNPGPPYYVARDGNDVIRLPGWTDLNAEPGK